MSKLPSIPNDIPFNDDNDTPLPLIVAKRWNFPLAHVPTEEGMFYAIQDWIRGLTGDKDVRQHLGNMKRKKSQPLFSKQQFPYTATNGKTYKMDFTDDKGLYLIAQHLRVTGNRPVLDQIKKFLAASGAFVDEIRIDPDQALEAALNGYRAKGHSDRWIWMRIEGKIRRNLFTAALGAAVAEMLTPRHYAMATDDIYRGLWGRTAAHLKRELDVPKNASLRDHQPMMGLYYQGIAEEAAALKLGEREELTWHEAREIVQIVANFVGKQAQDMAHFMQMDLATGRPLMSGEF